MLLNMVKLMKLKLVVLEDNYDVINPPLLHIKDNVGTGATGYAAVEGSLSELRILDAGFDYEETPIITISGGNGSGAVVDVNMKQIDHSVISLLMLISDGQTYNNLGIQIILIGFNTYHKFRNAEKVIYILTVKLQLVELPLIHNIMFI